MALTLYHYVHCPFCVRVRMALGYLNLPYESVVLAYNDEETPVKLTGKKMLPALSHAAGTMNESLDIIDFIDKEQKLQVKKLMGQEEFKSFEKLLGDIGNPVHSLAMPYWIWTPEFSPEARAYFQKKKEEKRGPFKDLVKNQEAFKKALVPLLKNVEEKFSPFFESKELGLKDIMLAAHLWGLYVVPEFQFSPAIHEYLLRVKEICHFNYHQDFWS